MTYPDDPYRPSRPRFILHPDSYPPYSQPPGAGWEPSAPRATVPPPRTFRYPAPSPPPAPEPPPRKGQWLRYTLVAVVAFAAGVGATAAWKANLNVSALTGKTAKPLTCSQQYAKWKTGPAQAEGKKMEAALSTVQHANDDIVTINTGLKEAGADATQLEAYPMPACADPADYWKQTLADIKASGDNAGSATGLAALIAAEVPLKNVPALETKLTAELKTTTK